jgi:1-acyl-sn-glycerol-3-phosphate acyltransferase
MTAAEAAGAGPADGQDAECLVRLAGDFAAVAVPGRAAGRIGLDTPIGTEVGLDSLAVVELRSRVEEFFGVVLPDEVLVADTLGDWLVAVRAAQRGAGPVPGAAAGTARAAAGLPGPSAEAAAPAGAVPAGAETLCGALAWHADSHPARMCIRILEFGAEPPGSQEITYGQLDGWSRAVASGLRAGGLAPGDRVAIMLPTCAAFFSAFMGTLMAGGVAVPVYPPSSRAGLEEHVRRQAAILTNAGASVLITVREAMVIGRVLRDRVPSLRLVTTEPQLRSASGSGPLPAVHAGDLALLQYTSGSTGDPKGVMLSHRHLLANIAAMGGAANAGPGDVFVSWLPLYHDMGLIGAWLAGLRFGFPLVVMSPLAFLSRPARWLQAISRYRGTLSAAPNFGFELCTRQVPAAELEDLDLSCWRLAFDGSEAVSAQTLRRFAARFAVCGLRPQTLAPAYGLAEAGVGVTFPPPGRALLTDVIDREVLARIGRAMPAKAGGHGSLEIVSCGRVLPGYRVRVADSAGRALGARREGLVEFTGPSATPGYYRNEAATRPLRHDGWTATGDLGYLADGELYLTGRSKDIIIRRGRNLHPDQAEEAIGRLPGTEPGGAAVFGCPDPQAGTERLVVAAETRLTDADTRERLRDRIARLTTELLGTAPDDVVLAAPGSLPKTSSGKIRRGTASDRYRAGTLGQAAQASRWQTARFAVSGAGPRLRYGARAGARLGYAAYAWAVTVLAGAPAWLLIAILPAPRARWAVLRQTARLLHRALAVPLAASGELPTSGPFVIVANHASLIDGLVLAGCLDDPACFAVSAKFSGNPVIGPFLRRIGAEFVSPDRPQEAVAATRRLTAVLAAGRSLAVWPEGSLSPAPGVRRFHLGAFEAAAAAGAPVVPVGLQGTRAVLRPGSRLPRRAGVHVAIGTPLTPAGDGWLAATALRDRSRAAVLDLSGEADAG